MVECGGGIGNQFLKVVSRRLGLRWAYFCLYFIVPYFYLFAPKARRSLHEYWRYVEPDKGRIGRLFLVLGHMRRYGQLLLDRVVQTEHGSPYFHFISNGFENIREPIEKGEGVILLSAHVGAWDLASAYAYRHQLNEPFHMVQYAPAVSGIESLKGGAEPSPPKVIYSNREQVPILSLHRLLAEGRPVALMSDRPVGKHFELVPFFGHLAPFDTTPFKLAATTGKPLVFCFNFKGPGRTYEFFAKPGRTYHYAADRDREEQWCEWAAEFARCLEENLRLYPDQWSNFFPFWSTPPSPPEAFDKSPRRATETSSNPLTASNV